MSDHDLTTLSGRMRHARERTGKSVEQVAEEAGSSVEWLRACESGVFDEGVKKLDVLAGQLRPGDSDFALSLINLYLEWDQSPLTVPSSTPA